MNKSLRKWLRRLLFLVPALLLSLVLIAGTALVVLDEDDYRDALVWAGQRYLDSTLIIDGELSLSLGKALEVHAQGLRFESNDGLVAVSIRDFGARLPLKPLLTGTVWLENLTLVGARVDIDRSADSQSRPPSKALLDPPRIVLQETVLLDVSVAYRDADGITHDAHLDKLLIEEAPDEAPVQVSGEGRLNGQAVEISGTVGSREQLLDAALPFPIDLDIRWGNATMQLTGAVNDPIRGRGINIELSANDPDFAASLALLGERTPPIGALEVAGTIAGDSDQLSVERLLVSLRRDALLDIKLEGRIGHVQSLSDIAVDVVGDVTDADIWQWMTQGRLPGFNVGSVRGTLNDDDGRLRITGLDVETSAPSALKMGLQGEVDIGADPTSLDELDIDVQWTLSAPGLAAVKTLVDHDLPELGVVRMASRLMGQPPLLDFEGLQATVGDSEDRMFRFQQGQGQIDLRDGLTLQDARIQMTANAPRPGGLSRLFGFDMPGVGQTTAQGTWHIQGPLIRLEPFETTVQLTGGSLHRLAGSIAHRPGRSTTADLSFDLDTDQVLALWSDDRPSDLGRIEGQIELLKQNNAWQVRQLQLESRQTELFKIHIDGKGDTRQTGQSPKMKVRLQVDDPPRLLAKAGLNALPLASIAAEGTLTASEGKYRFFGQFQVGSTTSQTALTTMFQEGRPVIKGDIEIPRLTLADIGLSVERPYAAEKAPVDNESSSMGQDRPKSAANRLSREPIDLRWLHQQDLDLNVKINELRGVNLEIDAIEGQILLDQGRLRLNQANFRYFGGSASTYYEIDARATPAFKVDLRIDDLALGDILAEVLPDTLKGGLMDMELKLEGQGQSLHAVAASLDGALDIAFENTKIPTAYIKFLSADLLGWTLGKAALSNPYGNLDCGLIGLDIESGVVQSHVLLAEGPNLGVSGNVNVDFGAETLDLILLPTQKQTILIDATPVEVSGSLYDPTIEAIPTSAAARRVGRMVILPQVFLPVEVLTQGWRLLGRQSRGTGCTEILGRSVDQGFAFENAQPLSSN